MLVRYNKFHQAIFMNMTAGITGKLNEKYNGVEYYFRLKATNDLLVKENERLHRLLKEDYEGPDSNRKMIADTIETDSGK